MKILIIGMDGYLGWPLAMHLTQRGHEVFGIDNGSRRDRVTEMGSVSALPVLPMRERLAIFEDETGKSIGFQSLDVQHHEMLTNLLKDFQPDGIAHLGEMPSAPYSMIDFEHARDAHANNVGGTLSLLWAMRQVCPEAHLLKLGTMGAYGTPRIPIAEGFFEVTYKGHTATVAFPRLPGSFYHATKVHDSVNIEFTCRVWGVRSTDIMQGVVYGTRTDETILHPGLCTRFDFDEAFGTAINRFCAQAVIGLPLTPYGKGRQIRGFLPLRDSIQCMTLLLEKPPVEGEYRVVNQFEDAYNVTELAEVVAEVGQDVFGREITIQAIQNPRKEAEEHFYEPDHQKLFELGYVPTRDMKSELRGMLADLAPNADRIRNHQDSILPKVLWCRTLKIVVTGGAGFIGGHLAASLAREGHRILTVDRLPLPFPKPEYGHIQANLENVEVQEAIREFNPDVVFHLAAESGIGSSLDSAALRQGICSNIEATVATAESCMICGAKLIFASTGAMYSLPQDRWGPSKAPWRSAYGITKSTSEEYIRLFEQQGLRATIIRLSNVYGHQWKPKAVVGSFLKAALEGQIATIKGTGEQQRDFVYVGDVVSAFGAAMENGDGATVNVSTGVATSIKELWSMIEELVEEHGGVRYDHSVSGGNPLSRMDPTAEKLGWTPKTDLRSGLVKTVAAHRKLDLGRNHLEAA